MENWVALLIGVALIGGIVVFSLLRKKPQVTPPEPTPTEPGTDGPPCIQFLGIDVTMPIRPSWWDPTKFPPYHFPLGNTLCFEAVSVDCNPYDNLKPLRYVWYLHSADGRLVTAQEGGAKWCWSGEGVGASCGTRDPIELQARCVMVLTDGSMLEQGRTLYVVPEKACRR